MSLVNFDFLDREAQLYNNAKKEAQQSSLNIRTTIENNTKEETEAVKRAIDALNKKVECIMNNEAVKNEQKKIENSQKQMESSINIAAKTFFKVRDIIRQKNFSKEDIVKMERKVYEKIISKFLTPEEIEMFERMVSMGPIMIVPGGTVGRNNLMLN